LKKPGNAEDSLIAIVFSAAAVEAFINDLEELAAGTGGSKGTDHPKIRLLADVLSEAEESKASARLKYFLIGSVLKGEPFKKGAQPWQDLELLLKLRDAVVHSRPMRFAFGENGMEMSGAQLVAQLRQRGLLPEFPEHVKMFFVSWLSPRSVARWAINTSTLVIHELVGALPDGEFKNGLEDSVKRHALISGPSSNDAGWTWSDHSQDDA